MIHERDVRSKLGCFLRDEMSLSAFADWLDANSWNMHKDTSQDAVNLVLSIELLMAERAADAAYSDRDFRRDLSNLLDVIVVSEPASFPQPTRTTGRATVGEPQSIAALVT